MQARRVFGYAGDLPRGPAGHGHGRPSSGRGCTASRSASRRRPGSWWPPRWPGGRGGSTGGGDRSGSEPGRRRRRGRHRRHATRSAPDVARVGAGRAGPSRGSSRPSRCARWSRERLAATGRDDRRARRHLGRDRDLGPDHGSRTTVPIAVPPVTALSTLRVAPTATHRVVGVVLCRRERGARWCTRHDRADQRRMTVRCRAR